VVEYDLAMRIANVLLLLFVLASPLSAQNESRGNPRVLFEDESVDEMIAAYMAEHDVSGVSLAIVQAPYVTRAAGYGFSDPQRKTLVSVNTMFDVAGMRDAFTAVALMQLVEAGKLEVADAQRLLRRPAAEAEQAVAARSGEPYPQFVRRNQLDRIGLRHTFFGSELPRVAREEPKPGDRHQRFLHEPVLIDPTEPAVGNAPLAAEGIYASASDVSIWDIALAGDILIKDAGLRKLLYVPPAEGPWFFPGRPGLMITTGSSNGFSSLLSRFTHRDELLCVTLLANREGLDLTQLARRVAGAFNPKLGPPAKAKGMRVQQSPYSVAETNARLERVRGTSQIELGAVSVWEENGQVWIAAAAPDSREARAAVDRVLLQTVTTERSARADRAKLSP